jgi:hypothetical protein
MLTNNMNNILTKIYSNPNNKQNWIEFYNSIKSGNDALYFINYLLNSISIQPNNILNLDIQKNIKKKFFYIKFNFFIYILFILFIFSY